MSEKFTFEKCFGDGAGIHADHNFVSTSGKPLNFMRKDVFSRTVFSGDEHGRICFCNPFHIMPELLHFRTVTPEHLRSGGRCGTFFGSIFPVADGRESLDQFGIVPRLDDKV